MTKGENMLFDLGYRKTQETNRYLKFSTDGLAGDHIDIDCKEKRVKTSRVSINGNLKSKFLEMKEFEALYEIFKEKGWIK